MTKTGKSGLRAQILRAARKLLISEGSRNISMRKIAAEIGCKAPSIYYHFKNKDQLIHQLIDEGFEMQFEALSNGQQNVHDSVSPLEKLDLYMRTYVKFALDNPELYEVMYLTHSTEMVNFPSERSRRTRQSLDLGASLYREAMAAGLAAEDNPDLASTTISVILNGYISMVLMGRLDTRFNEESLLQNVIGRCFRAIGAQRETTEPMLAAS